MLHPRDTANGACLQVDILIHCPRGVNEIDYRLDASSFVDRARWRDSECKLTGTSNRACRTLKKKPASAHAGVGRRDVVYSEELVYAKKTEQAATVLYCKLNLRH